jgi:hypothetical protein
MVGAGDVFAEDMSASHARAGSPEEDWDGKMWCDVVACWGRGWSAGGGAGQVAANQGEEVAALGVVGHVVADLAALAFRVGVADHPLRSARNWNSCADGEGLCGGGDAEPLGRRWRGGATEWVEVVGGAARRLLRRGSTQGWHLQRFLSWLQLAAPDPELTAALATLLSAPHLLPTGFVGGEREEGAAAGGDAGCGEDAGRGAAAGGGGGGGGGGSGGEGWSRSACATCERCEQVLALHVLLVVTRNLDSWVALLASEFCASVRV